jgi:hypothetical protein
LKNACACGFSVEIFQANGPSPLVKSLIGSATYFGTGLGSSGAWRAASEVQKSDKQQANNKMREERCAMRP